MCITMCLMGSYSIGYAVDGSGDRLSFLSGEEYGSKIEEAILKVEKEAVPRLNQLALNKKFVPSVLLKALKNRSMNQVFLNNIRVNQGAAVDQPEPQPEEVQQQEDDEG